VRCSKLMIVDVGQQDDDGRNLGALEAVHSCLSCDYTVRDDRLRRPLPTRTSSWFADRLARLRLEGGRVVPIVYDTSPFPPGEFDSPEAA
jgi:hypothetical protein